MRTRSLRNRRDLSGIRKHRRTALQVQRPCAEPPSGLAKLHMCRFSTDGLAGWGCQLRHGFSAILMVSGFAWGCGGKIATDSQGTSDPGRSVTKEQFIETFVASECEYFASCPDISVGFAPGTDCTVTFFENPRNSPWLSPLLRFNPAAGAACLDAMAQLSCARGSGATAAIMPCFAVFRGDAGAGATCSVEEECKPELACDFAKGCPGVCTTPKRVGEFCAHLRCESGLTCGTGMVCAALKPKGAACSTEHCEPGTMCDDGGTKTCRPYSDFVGTRSTGQSCRMDLECSSADYCNLSTRLCAPKLNPGAPCRPTYDVCVAGTHCGISGDDTIEYSGICIADIPLGGFCDSEHRSAKCENGARCISGTCGFVVGLGEPCDSHDACMSDYCDAGRCAIKPACVYSRL